MSAVVTRQIGARKVDVILPKQPASHLTTGVSNCLFRKGIGPLTVTVLPARVTARRDARHSSQKGNSELGDLHFV